MKRGLPRLPSQLGRPCRVLDAGWNARRQGAGSPATCPPSLIDAQRFNAAAPLSLARRGNREGGYVRPDPPQGVRRLVTRMHAPRRNGLSTLNYQRTIERKTASPSAPTVRHLALNYIQGPGKSGQRSAENIITRQSLWAGKRSRCCIAHASDYREFARNGNGRIIRRFLGS